MTLFLSC